MNRHEIDMGFLSENSPYYTACGRGPGPARRESSQTGHRTCRQLRFCLTLPQMGHVPGVVFFRQLPFFDRHGDRNEAN